MSQKICKTNLLTDVPSSTDEFGSHQKLADAISNLITKESDGGKAIGIEGTWGSGKSTVINLIIKNLSRSNDNLVVLFDAWAHHGDPLRRTFLERLILAAEEKKWVNIEYWKDIRLVIAQKLKIETKTTHSNLKPWARWLIISTLFLPIGQLIFKAGLESELLWPIMLGLGILLLPVAILFFVMITSRNVGKSVQKKGKNDSNNDTDPLTFLFQKTTTDTQSKTFQTINPTSIEFEQLFSELMKESLSDKKHKVIVVLDNLDRIEASDAISLLATLQTFLQYSGDWKEWLNRLWIIIPYDRKGLEKLWKTDKYSDDSEKSLATSFLDKRFQIRFEVPPLVLSHWSAFLKDLIREAFPSHKNNDEEIHTTYRVFALYRENPDLPPTPRDLKLYVNQIGSIHRQWQDAYSLAHYGFYVLLKRKGEDIISGLQSGEYVQEQLVALLGESIQDALTALAFNVNLEQARQLLLKDPIEVALGKGDETTLVKLSENPGFSQVLESITFSEWTEKETTRLSNAARVLESSAVLSKLSVGPKNLVLKELRRSADAVTSWPHFDESISGGIKSLLTLLDANERLIRKTLDAISSTPIGEDKEGNHKVIHSWLEGVLNLINVFHNKVDIGEESIFKIKVPASAEQYIEFCSQLFEMDGRAKFWHLFIPTSSFDEISQAFLNSAQANTLLTRHVGAIKVLKRQTFERKWEALTSGINSKLSTATNIPAQTIGSELAILWELRKQGGPQAESSLKSLTKDGFILHHLVSAKSDKTAASYCLLTQFHFKPDYQNTPQQGNSTEGIAFINQLYNSTDDNLAISTRFVELLSQKNAHKQIYKIQSSPNSKNWLSQLIKIAATHDDVQSFFPPDIVSSQWKFIMDALPQDEYESLFGKLLSKPSLLKFITDSDFEVAQAGFYSSIVRIGGVDNANFKNWCISGIQKIESSELQNHINNEDNLTELLIDLVENDVKFDLGIEYQDILFSHGVALMEGRIQVTRLKTRWERLFGLLKLHACNVLRARLVDEAKQRGEEINQHFFEIYGNELVHTVKLEKNQNLVLQLFTPLVKNKNVSGMRWILNVLQNRRSFIKIYSPKDELIDFRDRVQEMLSQDNTDEVSDVLKKLENAIKDLKTRKSK